MPRRKWPDRRVTSQSTRIPRAGGARGRDNFPRGNPALPSQGRLSRATASSQRWSHSPVPLCQLQIPPGVSEEAWAKCAPSSAGKMPLLAASSLPVLSLLGGHELLPAHAAQLCDKDGSQIQFWDWTGFFSPPSAAKF